MRVQVAAGEWLPDRATVMAPGLYDVVNLEPVGDGWKYIRAPKDAGYTALPGLCRGAARGRTQGTNGTASNFTVAGTDQALFLATNLAFVDVSKAGAPPVYSLGGDDRWDFALYGDRIIAGGPKTVPPQSYVVGVDSQMSDLSVDAPFAGSWMEFQEFVVAGDLLPRGVHIPDGIRGEGAVQWCVQGNPESWPQIGSDAALNGQSDWQLFAGDGGTVYDLVSAGEWALILRERQTIRMDYVGSPNIFAFRKLDDHRGALLRNCGIAVGRLVYYLSEEGFVVCDGSSVQNIGHEKVDRWVLRQLNLGKISRMSVAHDAERQSVVWSLVLDASTPNVQLGYKYTLERWYKKPVSTSWLLTTLPSGQSMDQPAPAGFGNVNMDVASPTGLGDVNLDSLTVTGSEVLSFFQPDGKLYTFDADFPLNAELTLGDFTAPNGDRALVRWTRPLYKSLLAGDVGLAMNLQGRRLPNADPDLTDPATLRVLSESGYFRNRQAGRYFRGRLFMAGGFDPFEGVDVELVPLGSR